MRQQHTHQPRADSQDPPHQNNVHFNPEDKSMAYFTEGIGDVPARLQDGWRVESSPLAEI